MSSRRSGQVTLSLIGSGESAKDGEVLRDLTSEVNRKLQSELPNLSERRNVLARELDDINSLADKLITEWVTKKGNGDFVFVREKLEELEKRRGEIERTLASLDEGIAEIEADAVDAEVVKEALADLAGVFDTLAPV